MKKGEGEARTTTWWETPSKQNEEKGERRKEGRERERGEEEGG